MPEDATQLSCPYLGAEVELTSEREEHIAKNHPELLPDHRLRLVAVLHDPEEIRRSIQLASALLFSKYYSDLLGGKHVVVVVVTGTRQDPRNWILTAYVTRKLADGESVWKKN